MDLFQGQLVLVKHQAVKRSIQQMVSEYFLVFCEETTRK